MFEREQFVADCRAAFAEDPTHKTVREVLARAISDPTAVLKGLGEPQRAEIQKIFHSDALTILNLVWAPGMMVMPHNHRMWAVIGIYTGREDNVFWRRLKGTPNKIEAVGAKALCEMDAEPLGTDIIHSVINPINKLTGAIHIYGGDFFCCRTQRVGLHDATRTSVRRRTGEACVRRSQRALRSKQTHWCELIFDLGGTRTDVCFWHKADMAIALSDVRLWG
jgi:predicted metal-dependent enzyme (double-stranded beta helix superfamily)